MDNLSHSLLGLAVGALTERCLPREATPAAQKTRARMLLVTGWLGANLPDLDLVLTGLLAAPLGYLLHHRGHTHTIVFAIAQALVLMLLVALLWPSARRLLRESLPARTGLAIAAVVGLATHLLLDFFNSYGIHPFYPWSGRWLFGDMIFILEPVFWFAFGIPLLWMAPWRWLRLVLLAGAAVFLYWASGAGYLHAASVAVLVLIGAILSLVQLRAGAHGRQGLVAGIALAAGFVLLQGAASQRAHDTLVAHLGRLDPGARMLDAALTAFPSNPACWNYVTFERAGDSYRLRRGMLTVVPAAVPGAACPAPFAGQGRQVAGGITETMSASGPIADLHQLAQQCHGAAWLRFARMPLLEDQRASDLRFSRGGSNFSTLKLADVAGQPCPVNIPPWNMPREDVLQAR